MLYDHGMHHQVHAMHHQADETQFIASGELLILLSERVSYKRSEAGMTVNFNEHRAT